MIRSFTLMRVLLLVAGHFSVAAVGQSPAVTSIVARLPEAKVATRTLTITANTELVVRLNQELSTKQNKQGDAFTLSVAQDVMKDGYIVIPRGSRTVGEITWMTGKGAFGKSGKMDIEMRYIEVSGQRIPITGKFRQEGEGNTVATVAAIAVVWVAAPFITGKTGRIPAGRELTVYTRDDLIVALPAQAASDPSNSNPTVSVTPSVDAPPKP